MIAELWIEIYVLTNTKTIHQLSILSRYHDNLLINDGVEILNKYLSYRYKDFTLNELIHAGYFSECLVGYLEMSNRHSDNQYLNVYGPLKPFIRLKMQYIDNYFHNCKFKDQIISHTRNVLLLDNGQIYIDNKLIKGKYLMIDSINFVSYALTVKGEVVNLTTMEKISGLTNNIKIYTTCSYLVVIDRAGYKYAVKI